MSDHETLSARIDRLTVENGLTVQDRPALIDTVARGLAGAAVTDDASLMQRMRAAGATQASPSARDDSGPSDPAFRTWLAGLAPLWDKMPPERRLSLVHEYRSATTTDKPADVLRRELTIRHGTPDETRWPNLDRSRIADLTGQRARPTTNTLTPGQLSAINAIRDPIARHAAVGAAREYRTIANSQREFDQTRAKSLLQRYGAAILAA